MLRPCRTKQKIEDASIPKQLKTDFSRPYCRHFSAYKSGARDDLVSSVKCDRRFRFSKTTIHTTALRTRECAIFLFNSPRSARAVISHVSAETHKFKSAVLVSGVLFQKSTFKKLEHALSCKSSGPCPKLSARVLKVWSAVPKMIVV